MAFLVQYANGVPAVKHEINQSSLTIGEGIDNDVCIPEDGVTDFHAVMVAVRNDAGVYEYFIKPVDEQAGLLVNDEAASDLVRLHENDMLQIGEVTLRFTDEDECLIDDDMPLEEAAPVEVPVLKTSQIPSTPEPVSVAASSQDNAGRFSRRLNIF